MKTLISNPRLEYYKLLKLGVETIIINGHKDSSSMLNFLEGTTIYKLKDHIYEVI